MLLEDDKHSKFGKGKGRIKENDNNREDELQGCKVPFPLICFKHYKLHDCLDLLCMHVRMKRHSLISKLQHGAVSL